MKTKMLKIKRDMPDMEKISVAAGIIADGGIVAFPTETVYGLGANALDGNAVAKIFAAKGRPQDNPIIVHVSSIAEAKLLASEITKAAKKLMVKFWPGPLTLVMKSSGIAAENVTAGLSTVALRMPSDKIAFALIKESGFPIAAPSANISGRPSATEGRHVIDDLKGKVDVIIDAGPCKIGIESTVVDVTGKIPIVLRPGKITLEQIMEVCGRARLHRSAKGAEMKKGEKAISPGMKYRHYAPRAKVVILGHEINGKKLAGKILKSANGKTAFITSNKNSKKITTKKIEVVFLGSGPENFGKRIFAEFRRLDSEGYQTILVQGIKGTGFGLAVMDRVIRASK